MITFDWWSAALGGFMFLIGVIVGRYIEKQSHKTKETEVKKDA